MSYIISILIGVASVVLTTHTPPYIHYIMYTGCHCMSRGHVFRGNGPTLVLEKRKNRVQLSCSNVRTVVETVVDISATAVMISHKFLQRYRLACTPSSTVTCMHTYNSVKKRGYRCRFASGCAQWTYAYFTNLICTDTMAQVRS